MAAGHLYMVETVDSQKLVDILNKECANRDPLKVLVQVLTGDEDSKFGVKPENVNQLVQHIVK